MYAGGPSLWSTKKQALQRGHWKEQEMQEYCWIPADITHLYLRTPVDPEAEDVLEQVEAANCTSFSRPPYKCVPSLLPLFQEHTTPLVYVVAFDDVDRSSLDPSSFHAWLVEDACLAVEVLHKEGTTFEITHIHVSLHEWAEGYCVHEGDMNIFCNETAHPGFAQFCSSSGLGHFIGFFSGTLGKGYFSALLTREEFQSHQHRIPASQRYTSAKQRITRLLHTLGETEEDPQGAEVAPLLDQLERILHFSRKDE